MEKTDKLSRRGFIRAAGIAGVAPAMAAFPFQNLEAVGQFEKHPQEQPTFKISKKVPQVCSRACEINCAVKVVVGTDTKTGLERAITIEGWPEDPVSKGKYCIKAMGFVDSLYNPDRLMVALKRTNPRKGTDSDPGWVTLRSADAVNEIIDVMRKYKPEEILIASPGNPFTNKLCKSMGVIRSDQRTECFGTHYYINCLTITNPPNDVYSSTYTPSHHLPGYDYDLAKYQIWFGFDSFTKSAKAGMLPHWLEGKKNGSKIVMFNPVRTPISDNFADQYYSIKPGTDLAVALAIINTIVSNKKYNTEFLTKYSDAPALVDLDTRQALKTDDGGFYAWCTEHKQLEPLSTCHAPALDGGTYTVTVAGKEIKAKPVLQLLAETTKPFTPEWAAPITDVKASAIRKIALDFAAAAPYAVVPTNKRDAAGPNYANSWRLRHSLNVINTLVGAIDHEGGLLLLHDVKMPWLEDLYKPAEPYPALPSKSVDFRHEFPVTNDIYRQKDFSAPGHYGMVGYGLYTTNTVKVVIYGNPHRGLFATIQPQMLEAGLAKKDMVVDWNLYLDDLGYWCDYVLPAPHNFEEGKLDVRTYYPKQACLVGGAPVQKPPGDQIGWGTVTQKIGLALAPKYWTTDGSGDPKKAVPMGIGDAALKLTGAAENSKEFMAKGAFWIDNKPYENYKQIRQQSYGRPNGRVRIFIDEFSKVDHSPLPTWDSRWQEPDENYKFSLLITRAPWYMHADPNFINNPILKHLTTMNYMDTVWISPTAGKKLGLKDGDQVIVESNPKYMTQLPRPVKAKVHLSKRITRDDCMLAFHGIGHRAKNLRVAKDFGYRDGDLIPQKDPMMSKKKDPLGMGWVEDVYVSIRKA